MARISLSIWNDLRMPCSKDRARNSFIPWYSGSKWDGFGADGMIEHQLPCIRICKEYRSVLCIDHIESNAQRLRHQILQLDLLREDFRHPLRGSQFHFSPCEKPRQASILLSLREAVGARWRRHVIILPAPNKRTGNFPAIWSRRIPIRMGLPRTRRAHSM